MERFHLLNKLEQLHHIDRKPSNQLVFIPHVEHVEPIATPTIVQHGVTYPQGTWPMRSVLGLRKQLQVLHHRPRMFHFLLVFKLLPIGYGLTPSKRKDIMLEQEIVKGLACIT